MSAVSDSIDQILKTGAIAQQWANGGENETVQTDGGPLKTLAGINKSMVSKVIDALSAVSNTQLTVSVGTKTLVIQAGKSFQPGQAVSLASGANIMAGFVNSYVNDTLVVDVVYFKGSGTLSSWQVAFSGPPGATPDTLPPVEVGSLPKLITKMPWQ